MRQGPTGPLRPSRRKMTLHVVVVVVVVVVVDHVGGRGRDDVLVQVIGWMHHGPRR